MAYRHAAQSRGVTPSDEDLLEEYKCSAYNCHDTLLADGGRPTRQVRDSPAGKAVYEQDQIRILNEHGELQITLAPNEDLTVHHWKMESTLFEEQLERWKELRGFQKDRVQVPLLRISLNSNNVDQRLIGILVQLNDWRDFQHYQRRKVGRELWLMNNSTQRMKEIMYEESTSSVETQFALVNYFWDNMTSSKQDKLEASQMQLAWIEGQILEILAEACDSLAANASLLQELEMKLEQQVSKFDQELKNLEAKPARRVQYPHQSAGPAQKLCHWGSEITRLFNEYWEWKQFLKWRRTPECTEKRASIGDQASCGQISGLQIWQDYVSYRRCQLDRARVRVAGWQEKINFEENRINTTSRDRLYMLKITISGLRAKVDKFQRDVQIAELRVRSAEQQLDDFAQQRPRLGTSYTTDQLTTHPSLPLGPLDSESTAIIPEDSTATSSTVSPVTEVPDPVQSSNVLNKGEGAQAEWHDTTRRQSILVAEAAVSDQINPGNDIQPTDAPSHSYSDAATGDGDGSGLLHTDKIDLKDALMTDVEDLVASKAHSKSRGTRAKRKSPLLTHQAPTSRKTRSGVVLEQSFSGRVLKHAGKKPARNAKTSIRTETKAILNATSLEGPPTDSPPPRRSQRLKEKAAASH